MRHHFAFLILAAGVERARSTGLCVGITLASLGSAFLLPATVGAQPPIYLTQWGSFGSGIGQFNIPQGLATDAAGNVYVADLLNNRIQKFTTAGTYLTQWGSPGIGNGQFYNPAGVATDAAGNVYVAEAGNNRIQKFTSTGTYLTQWGSFGSADGQFNTPIGVVTDAAGDVYVGDYYNHRIQKFTSTGTYLSQWGSGGNGNGQFNGAGAVAMDAASDVYVVDTFNHRVQKFTSSGTYLTQWGSFGSADSQFNFTVGVATDAAGNVYVSDLDNNRVQKFTASGTYLTQWGSVGSGDGQFDGPVGVATDALGNVYVAEQRNHRIQKFGPAPNTVAIASFDASEADGVVTLRSEFRSDLGVDVVNVYRGVGADDNPLLVIERVNDVRGDRFEYVDRDVALGQSYRYQIGVVDADGEFFSPIVTVAVAAITLELSQNQPNPFNPTTTIRFVLPVREEVTLAIYDASGHLVRTLVNEVQGYGAHEVIWDGRDGDGVAMGSGVYFYRLRAGKHTESKKMVLLK